MLFCSPIPFPSHPIRHLLELPASSIVTQSCPSLCGPWNVACQVPQYLGFSRQCPPPGESFQPRNRTESPVSPPLQSDSLPSEQSGKLFFRSPHPPHQDWFSYFFFSPLSNDGFNPYFTEKIKETRKKLPEVRDTILPSYCSTAP